MMEKHKERMYNRIDQLVELGLKWNGDSYVYKDINFHWLDITVMSDDEFEKAFAGASERMKTLSAEK